MWFEFISVPLILLGPVHEYEDLKEEKHGTDAN